MDITLGPWQKPDRQWGLGKRNQKGQFQSKKRDPDAMDVDVVRTNLDPTEVKKRRSEGRCFYCNRQGHMKKDCPKLEKEDKDKLLSAKPRDAKACIAVTKEQEAEEDKQEESKEEEAPPMYNQDSMMEFIKKMKTEDRDDFMDRLLIAEGQGF